GNNDTAANNNLQDDAKKHLYGYIAFNMQAYPDGKGGQRYGAAIGYVPVKDTALVRSYLEMPAVRNAFPAQMVWMYGIPERDRSTGKVSDMLPLYAIKTFGREKPKLEGDVITDARSDFDPTTSEPTVNMTMNSTGTRIWADMT